MSRKRVRIAQTLLLIAALTVPAAISQEGAGDLRSEIDALKQGQQEIKKQLQDIQKLLQARSAPARPSGPDVKGKVFDLGDNPVKGGENAEIVLVEFTDYQCPFCSRHVNQTHPQIASEYIDSGKIKFATLDLPLERIHPLAMKAAEATHCAEEQGKFWEMHDRLFANQKSLEPWSAHAEALEIDATAFDDCLNSGRYAEAVRRDMAEASKAGATGTPSFVLGSLDPEDSSKVKGIAFIRGAQPFNAFKAQIDAALRNAAKAEAEPTPAPGEAPTE
jgi:protein-disulfide isomerase